MNLAISLGGSVFTQALAEDRADAYVDVLAELLDEAEQLVVVVGAGAKKKRIEESGETNQAKRDLIGIDATRENAQELQDRCAKAELPVCDTIPASISALHECSKEKNSLIIMGGTEPGHSTDAVAAIAAELIGAELLLKATDVDGIYEKDPKKHPDAQRHDTLSYSDLIALLCEQEVSAGSYALFDLTAAKTIQRSAIETVVLDGTNPHNLVRVLADRAIGTRIS